MTAYFFLMSFVPFCLLLIAVFGHFLGENGQFYEFFSARLLSFFPAATSKISRQLTAIVVYRRIGIFTFIVYSYFSYQLYMALEEAIRVIFRQKAKRSLITSIVFSFSISTLIAALIILSFVATLVVQMLQTHLEVFPFLRVGKVTGFLIRFVIPVFLVVILTTALYKLLPLQRVPLLHALRGALFTAILLEVARHLFTLFVTIAIGQYGTIYGPLSAVVVLLLWVFYSSSIFFIGAEIVRNLGERYSELVDTEK
jgi:membrane protein